MRVWPFRVFAGAAIGALLGVILTAQVTLLDSAWTHDSVLPALAYGPHCSTDIDLWNLGDRPVTVEVEGHRPSGALVGLAGLPGTTLHMAAGQRGRYKLEIREETTSAWVKVRERSPPGSAFALAVAAASECIDGNQVRTVTRDVAFPQNNPWFDSDAAAISGEVVSLINTSPAAALVRVCYSAGNLYSAPNLGQRALTPICSIAFDVQIPPFGAREFPVERDGSTHFTLRTLGRAIVLEMLRPLDAKIRMYRVDSSIRFDDADSKPARR